MPRKNSSTKNSAMIPIKETDTSIVTPNANYEAVRYNALTHGTLSRLVVLPYENMNEFADLMTDLIDEHKPVGMTELHLVEELGAIMWRKRRVLMGEGAAINSKLKDVRDGFTGGISAAVLFTSGLSDTGINLNEILTTTPAQIDEIIKIIEDVIKVAERAREILRVGSPNAYEEAEQALDEHSRDFFHKNVGEGACKANAEGLDVYIREILIPCCDRLGSEARNQPALRTQTLGGKLLLHNLDKLNRYETHLDRKFQRTLSMLLQLKNRHRSSF